MKIIVLGAGLVGAPMAIDLTKEDNFDVTVADFSNDALNRLKVKCSELSVISKRFIKSGRCYRPCEKL